MEVLYDHQVFAWTRYAGIPRYFSELILALRNDTGVHVSIPRIPTTSKDYFSLMEGGARWCITLFTFEVSKFIYRLFRQRFHPKSLLSNW